jgi:hypothetical protein
LQLPLQQTAVYPFMLALQREALGLGPLVSPRLCPGQSPVPAERQPYVAGGGAAVEWATQVYMRPGLAPPVQLAVAMSL